VNIKEKNLLKILRSSHLESPQVTFIDGKDLIGRSEETKLKEVYHTLGGILEYPDIKLKGYFFETTKFVLEFDDQLSFNRYRIKTLRSDIYENFPGIKLEKFRNCCKKYERECLKSGTATELWTHQEAESLFGRAEKPGDLGLNGSPGWKLRALQDYLKDLYAKYAKKRILRLSVWDEILINGQLKKVGDILKNPDTKSGEFILKFIERRVINLFAD